MNETGTPLSENQYVKELFSILQDNGRDTSGLSALIGHVGEMENFIKRAEDKIADMKSQLSDMKEVQNHPVKAALQTAIKTLETKVAEVRERLSDLKNNIVEGCKNAVAAFKERGSPRSQISRGSLGSRPCWNRSTRRRIAPRGRRIRPLPE